MKSLWALGAGITFAILAACVKLVAQEGIPTRQIVFFRSLIPLLALYAYMRRQGLPIATPRLKMQLTGSMSGVTSLGAYFYAIKALPIGTAVTLNYLSPIFIALLLILRGEKSVNAAAAIALLIGFAGVTLLLQPSFDRNEWLGYVLAITSAVLGAMYFLNIRRLGSMGESAVRTVFYFSLFSSLASLPWALFGPDIRSFGLSALALLLAAGILATLGQLMITLAYQGGRPLVSAALGYSQIVFSVLLGMLVWHDKMPVHAGIGVLMIVVSGILASAFRVR